MESVCVVSNKTLWLQMQVGGVQQVGGHPIKSVN